MLPHNCGEADYIWKVRARIRTSGRIRTFGSQSHLRGKNLLFDLFFTSSSHPDLPILTDVTFINSLPYLLSFSPVLYCWGQKSRVAAFNIQIHWTIINQKHPFSPLILKRINSSHSCEIIPLHLYTLFVHSGIMIRFISYVLGLFHFSGTENLHYRRENIR